MNKPYMKYLWYKQKLGENLKDESGMGVIEIAIIIIVLIAIAILFRTKIMEIANKLLDSMNVDQALGTK